MVLQVAMEQPEARVVVLRTRPAIEDADQRRTGEAKRDQRQRPHRRYSGQVAAASGLMIVCPTWVGIIGFRYGSPADL
jgi:hypothetical protein